LFYGPLHYLLVREIVRALPGASDGPSSLLDLGCGTGAAGAAWAVSCATPPRLLGIDSHPWAVAEAARTYRDFGLAARTRQGDIAKASLPNPPISILASFTVNELPDATRDALLQRLTDRAARGDRVLVVEPLARSVTPWWGGWQSAFETVGGRADEWRFRVERPEIVAKLDRAAGLDHRELTGRSLWLARRSQ
jgi:SAM-dependent methyltransferase